MPTGEVNIQIGGSDTAAQLETYNSQPQTKYHRLKPTIANSFIFNENTRQKLVEDFEKIFSKVLKNRSLIGLSVNEIGLISIQIKESIENRTFDIDGMSSGEKGLILTFLLISHSVHHGGIIMIDEPELHLNPAVCKTLLTFLIEEYLVPNDIQAIICSHSPEILGSAFDSPNCTLLHIQSSTVISKIYSEDRREVFDALRRLGTSASDALFSAGSIFVEGDHDIEILETGFDELVGKYKITQLGGRGSIEREIKTLQAAEAKGEIDTLKCFIFDLDNAPSDLRSTRLIKVLQWKRRCIENYLIDEKIIYDLLNDLEVSKTRINSRGEVSNIFKKIAENQLQEVVAKEIYNQMNYENPGMRPREILGKTYDEMASALFSRLKTIQDQVNGLTKEDWEKSFKSKCNSAHITQKGKWDSDWIIQCDGKRFFIDLYKKYEIRVSPIKFKKMIIDRMLREQSETWVVIEKLLNDALKVD
jgi:predicted ATPase